MDCLLIATTLFFSFYPGHVSVESVIEMLCALRSQDNLLEVEPKSVLRLTNFCRLTTVCSQRTNSRTYFCLSAVSATVEMIKITIF